jgi:hypothetical protein
MKARAVLLGGIAVVIGILPAWAEKPLKDYSFIKGVNYHMVDDPAILERDLGYAKRIDFNSTRIWLNYRDYERDPQSYTTRLRNYVRRSHQLGFSTMPILFNGNGLDPDTLKPEFRQRGDAYVKAIVEAIKDEPGLLMWDIMNEPLTNNYYGKASAEEKPQREVEITGFIRHYLSYAKKLDPVNATTVGYNRSNQMEPTADLVDVLSFHEYTPLRSTIEQSYVTAEEISRKFGNKPMLNTETGCIARANPYDVVLQISQEHKTGWYLFNLMIEGYWAQIHGIFYPDGTVRDPAIVAAIMGFYRNRDLKTIIKPAPDREKHCQGAIGLIDSALRGNQSVFSYANTPTDKILDAAEEAANLLESSEMVPMDAPPSARILYWRRQPENQRDRDAIRAFAYQLGLKLKNACMLY